MDKKSHYLALILLEALEDENMKACKQLLIAYQANPNVIVFERGIAPIHYACGMENISFAEEIVKLMLDLGGDPNVKSDDKLTPLHVAAIWGRKNIVKMLLDKGGDITAIDEENNTPISYAIHECQFDVIKEIQNYVFKKKIEQKKINLLQQQQEQHLKNNNLSMIRIIEEKKYTPNRTNYNYDVISPYYINITHRKKTKQNQIQNMPADLPSMLQEQDASNETQNNNNNANSKQFKSFHEHVPENLFELTEKNLNEYANKISSDRSKISFINTWRDKVQKAKTRKSIINQFNDVDSLLSCIINDNANIDFTNTTLYIEGQDLEDTNKNKTKSFNLTQFGKLLEQLKYHQNQQQNQEQLQSTSTKNQIDELKTDDSFKTAPDQLGGELQKMSKCNNYDQSNFLHTPKFNDDFIVIQTAEEYVHTDEENGLIFYEKCIITNPNPSGSAKNVANTATAALNKTYTTESTEFTIPLDYNSEDLRRELTNFGCTPGPITKSTKKLYMKRLIKYKRNPEKMSLRQNTDEKKNRPNFSIELEKTVRNIEWFKRINDHMGLELEIIEEFKSKANLKSNNWREGHLKTSFIYLLIDPRISDNLSAQSVFKDTHSIWKKFLSSIFYVGKGKSIRPYQHLYDAMKIFSKYYEKQTKEIIEKVTIYGGQKIPKNIPLNKIDGDKMTLKNITDSKKIERILDIWKSEKGVICLHVFHNILPAEAYTREAAIIDAIGLEHLTNMKRGDYYGITKSWSMRQRKHLGIALLYKALQIFLIEGESQLLPCDLI